MPVNFTPEYRAAEAAFRRARDPGDRFVHKDLARSLKYARVWGRSGFDGQHVGRDQPLTDGDVVELHA